MKKTEYKIIVSSDVNKGKRSNDGPVYDYET